MTSDTGSAVHDFDLPAMLLRDVPLRRNIAIMADYCRQAGVHLAPHAKTSMTSYIAGLQLESGAWGQTAASIIQVRHLWNMGIRKILLANVLVDRRGIDWVARNVLSDDDSDFLCYVDSERGVQLLEEGLRRWSGDRELGVLVEVGFVGGRTGVRSASLARDLARRVAASPVLTLRGIAGFEGLMPRHESPIPPGLVEFLDSIHEAVSMCQHESLFDGSPVVTAGGSSYFDLVAKHLGPGQFDFGVTTILRSGCYATHDHGVYHETSPMDGRADAEANPAFVPALELLAHVWSRPEEDLVIAGFGRRDVPTDDRLPVVLGLVADGGELVPEPRAEVVGVNDQHAFIRVDGSCSWQVGDVLSMGVSHPCGAFDRWRTLPLVDERRRVIGEVTPLL